MVIKVPVVLSYNNKGTKQATKDINNLGKTIKKFGLGSKLSLAGATTALTVFTKRSIMAAAADDKAQKSLARSLKNLGLAYSSVSVEKFIKDTAVATGVTDDQLRPAFQRLVTATNSVAKSQELLNLALNVSAGTGKSLESVTSALSRAYLGNTTSLGRLGAGLSKAEIKAGSFEQITARLNVLFAGQATDAANSYSGKIDRLKVAAGEAAEVIGLELLASIEKLSGDQGIEGATKDLDNFANSTANVIAGVTTLASKLDVVGAFFTQKPFIFSILENVGASQRRTNGSAPAASALGSERQAIAAAKLQIQLNRKAAQEKAKELAAQRALAMSKKLAAKFDQENIAIEAALKGKLSDEDRARLLAMKALKSEIKTDDEKALVELEALQKKNAGAELARIKEIEAANTAANQKRKSELTALQEWLASNPLNAYINVITPGGSVGMVPSSFGAPSGNAQSAPPPTNASSVPVGAMTGTSAAGAPNVTVNVNAGTIADENKLTYIIADQIVKYVRFGGTTAPAGFI